MIEMTEKTVGVWFRQCTPKQDWMASISEIEPDKKYLLQYRFRYYKDDAAFDSKDEKNWYTGEITATRQHAIDSVRKVGNGLTILSPAGPLYEVINDGDYSAFLQKFIEMPFVHAKAVGPDGKELSPQ